MKYSVETTLAFDKEFKSLDRYTQKLLKAWIEKHLINTDNPRATGKGLTGDKAGLWRYRIGDYRIIADIQDGRLVILMLSVGHRKEIYR